MDITLKKCVIGRTDNYISISGLKHPEWANKFIQDIKEPYYDFKSYFEGKKLTLKDWRRGGTIYAPDGQSQTVFTNKKTGVSIDVFLKDVPRKTKTVKGIYYAEAGYVCGYVDSKSDFIWSKDDLNRVKETFSPSERISEFKSQIIDNFIEDECFVMIF